MAAKKLATSTEVNSTYYSNERVTATNNNGRFARLLDGAENTKDYFRCMPPPVMAADGSQHNSRVYDIMGR